MPRPIVRPARTLPLLAGAPSTLKITVQPPAGALDREVWIPSRQPTVVVKDANGVVVPGVTVTGSIFSGTGTLQGKVAITTNGSGVAKFVDLGIAGTGQPYPALRHRRPVRHLGHRDSERATCPRRRPVPGTRRWHGTSCRST